MKKYIFLLGLLLLPFIVSAEMSIDGDNLGSHIATKAIDTAFSINSSSSINLSGSNSQITSSNEAITITGQQYVTVNSSIVINGFLKSLMTNYTDQWVIWRSTTHVEDEPLIRIRDEAIGNESTEVTLHIDSDGTALHIEDGNIYFGYQTITYLNGQTRQTWEYPFYIGNAYFKADTNGTGNYLYLLNTPDTGVDTSILLYTDNSPNPNNCHDFNGTDTPTFAQTYNDGGDTGDHIAVEFGGTNSTVIDISSVWYWNLLCSTIAIDGTLDVTTTEKEPFYRIGRKSNPGTIEPAVGLSSGAVVITEGLQIGTSGYAKPIIYWDEAVSTQAYKTSVVNGVWTLTPIIP